MTLEQHQEAWKAHAEKSKEAIERFEKDGCWEDFLEFEREYHLWQKHWGIAKAMRTKQEKKRRALALEPYCD